jgi:hypothetical protein
LNGGNIVAQNIKYHCRFFDSLNKTKGESMMGNNLKNTWELYTASWRCTQLTERLALFSQSLDTDCCYTDPLTIAKGWDELAAYMEEFQREVPNGYFDVVDFLSQHDFSVARWEMKNGDGQKIGDGYSFGEYNKSGKLIKMIGFYNLPE